MEAWGWRYCMCNVQFCSPFASCVCMLIFQLSQIWTSLLASRNAVLNKNVFKLIKKQTIWAASEFWPKLKVTAMFFFTTLPFQSFQVCLRENMRSLIWPFSLCAGLWKCAMHKKNLRATICETFGAISGTFFKHFCVLVRGISLSTVHEGTKINQYKMHCGSQIWTNIEKWAQLLAKQWTTFQVWQIESHKFEYDKMT